MARVEVCVLGPVRARVGGEPVQFRGPMVRKVLALLAANHGGAVTTGSLIDELYGTRELPNEPMRNVATLIARLRGPLGQSAVRRAGDGWMLVVDEVDLVSLQMAMGRARKAVSPAAAIELLEGARRLWVGEPFEGGFDSHELEMAMDRARHYRSRVLTMLVESYVAIESFDSALEIGLPLLEIEQLNEHLAASTALAMAGQGRTSEALESLRLLRERLVSRASAQVCWSIGLKLRSWQAGSTSRPVGQSGRPTRRT